MAKNSEKRSLFRSIRFKINMAVAASGILLIIFSLWLLSDSMNYVERDLMNNRLASDIRYIRDELGEYSGSSWEERDGALYIGSLFIGDGTYRNANIEPFAHCGEITGSFFYTFVRTYNDEELIWVESGGYQQGHYLRAAGNTLGPNGENLEGTYIDVLVADAMENSEDGVYCGEANVDGIVIYCRYELLKDEAGENVGVIVVGRSTEEMADMVRKQKTRGAILDVLMLVVMSLGLGIIVSYMIGAIRKIRERLARIGKGELPDEPLVLRAKDELSDVADSVNEMVVSLKEKERIGAELSIATDIQSHMLPSIFPPFPEHNEFEIYATMNPAKEVGGDFYDFYMLDDRNLAVIVADVSGKGVPAALFMVIAKTLIKNHMQAGQTPGEVFTKVNQTLCEGNEVGLFVTAWMGVLNTETGLLTYVNAGHNPPLIRHADGRFEFLRCKPGFVLAGIEGMRFRQQTLALEPGAQVFLYTDGVTEATDPAQQMYGEERLKAYLDAHHAENVKSLLQGLKADIDAFQGEADQFDDITMLILNFCMRMGETGMVEREFAARDDELPRISAFLEETLEKLGCPPKAQMQLSVAVEEIFINIAHYAYPGQPGTMKLAIQPEEGGVSMRFTDHGMPFDPLSRQDPDITLSASERSVGGLGIFMVKKSMDYVRYRFENGQNILTLQKLF